MWIVDSPTPSSTSTSSLPNSPLPHITTHAASSASSNLTVNTTTNAPITHSTSPIAIAHPPPIQTSTHPSVSAAAGQTHPPVTATLMPNPTVSASALPGAHLSGRLSGVVSLTDILNLFARASGLQPSDPEEARRARRGSSASSRSGMSGRGVVV